MLTLYKPNSAGKGSALGIKFNSKEQTLFLSLIKQNGFGESGKGKFSGGKEVVAALGAHEVGGLLSVIESLKAPTYANEKATLKPKRREHGYHHESAKQTLKITFAPYEDKATGEIKGLSVSVFQTMKEGGEKTPYSFWAGMDEVFLLQRHLEFVLEHFFSADYAEDKKIRAERAKDGPKPPKEQSSATVAKTPEVKSDDSW